MSPINILGLVAAVAALVFLLTFVVYRLGRQQPPPRRRQASQGALSKPARDDSGPDLLPLGGYAPSSSDDHIRTSGWGPMHHAGGSWGDSHASASDSPGSSDSSSSSDD